ncbi:MAG TPA: hypothetical protein VF460_15050, partial [Burkholderiales bacterium]
QNGRRDREGPPGQRREAAGSVQQQQAQVGVQQRPLDDNRPGDAQSRNELPQIQGPNRRWDRDQNGRRDWDGPSGQRREAAGAVQPQTGAQQNPRTDYRSGQPQFRGQDRREIARPGDRNEDRNYAGRNSTGPDRREMARPERRNGTAQERGNFSRQERPGFSAPPQAQAVPQVQSIPRPQASAPMRQAHPAAPQARQPQAASPARAQTDRGGTIQRASPQARGGERGGQRLGDGNNFRPQMR